MIQRTFIPEMVPASFVAFLWVIEISRDSDDSIINIKNPIEGVAIVMTVENSRFSRQQVYLGGKRIVYMIRRLQVYIHNFYITMG